MNGCSVLCRNVAWVLQDSSFGGRATGRFSVADFVGNNFVKDGSWLGSPEAVRVPECRARFISQNTAVCVVVLSWEGCRWTVVDHIAHDLCMKRGFA